MKELEVRSLLDYGCGGSDYLAKNFHEDKSAKDYFNLEDILLYEPARGIDQRTFAEAVLCFDVLEHIFICDLPKTLREIFYYADKLVILNVACYPAMALLPNGENAHITVRPPLWWKGFVDTVAIDFPKVSVKLYCSIGWRKYIEYPRFSASDWIKKEKFEIPLDENMK